MNKETALRILINCAKDYSANLENNNLLFISGNIKNPILLETVFLPRNFKHLTGLRTGLSSSDFYRKCLEKRIRTDEFSFAPNGTSELKLKVLPELVNVHRNAKMIGDYTSKISVLQTEKLVGNVVACLGFVKEGNYYLPNTALKEDIRKITDKPQHRILATLIKGVKDTDYIHISYMAKGISIQEIQAILNKKNNRGEHHVKE